MRETSKTKAVVFLSGARLMSMVVTLLAVRIYTGRLSEEGYGAALFALTCGLYMTALDFGYADGARLLLLRAFAPDSTDDPRPIWKVSSVMAALVGLGGIAVMIAVGYATHGGHDPWWNAQLFLLAGINFAAQNLMLSHVTYFAARRQFGHVATNNLIVALGGSCLGILFVILTRSPMSVVAGPACSSIVATYVSYRAIRREFQGPTPFRRDIARDCLKQGRKNYLTRTVALLSNSDQVLIGSDVGKAALANYNNSVRLPLALFDLSGSVTQAIQPDLARSHMKSETAFARSVDRNGLIAFATGACFIFVPCAFGAAILPVWLDGRAYALGATIMLCIGAYRMLELYYSCLGQAMFAAGKPQLTLPFVVWNGLCTALLTVPAARWNGLVGVAIMNISIHVAQFFPLTLLIKRKVVPELAYIQHVGRIGLMVGTVVLIAMGGSALCHTDWITHHPLVGVALTPFAMLLASALVFGLRMAPLPTPIAKRLPARFSSASESSEL